MVFLKSIAVGAVLANGYWFLDHTIGAYFGMSVANYGATFVGGTSGALIYSIWNA